MTPPRSSGTSSRQVEREFSAGGVVVRGDEVVVVWPKRRGPDGRSVVGLPKGHPDGDESPQEAALREVREEAGVEAEIVDELGDVGYWYQREGRRIRKSVRFFLCRYLAGDPADHDHEIERAEWMALDRAAVELTFAGEREMIERALLLIERAR